MPRPSHSSQLSTAQYWVRSTDQAPRYVVLSYSLVTASLLGPNILLNALFSNTLSLHSSLNTFQKYLFSAEIVYRPPVIIEHSNLS
jgi:hypothetical protein